MSVRIVYADCRVSQYRHAHSRQFTVCSPTGWCRVVDRTRVPVLIHHMRVVQVANFYGPRSGGLRTAVDRLGAEYCAVGHDVYLLVPGPAAANRRMPSGVTRISLPARRIPFTGGYRAVSPRPITALLKALEPDAIEVSDRLTLRSLGRWGREHD